MRKPLIEIPNTFSASKNSKIVEKNFHFELISPMFGGDYESWQLDLKNPVRSQSVKGQLRFWWRTMQNEENHNELLRNENALWGGKISEEISLQSKIKISLVNQKILEKKKFEQSLNSNNKFTGVKDCDIPQYVLFPIRDKVEKNEEIYYIKSLSFELRLSYPVEHENEIINTLKLWALFGGVGARTRRGTGSIYCRELFEDFRTPEDIGRFLRNSTSQIPDILEYPRISGASLFRSEEGSGDSFNDYKNFLDSYGEYRQGAGAGERYGRGGIFRNPGRSYWPEPDSIRRITGMNAPNHQPEHPDGIWFPRAAFGLPIQTEFKNAGGDPRGTFMLEPVSTGGRWPSPMFLKVIKLNDGKVYKVCLVLNQKFPSDMVLKGNRDYDLKPDEMPDYFAGKVMKTNDNLNGRSIYTALSDSLGLEEVRI